MSEMAVDSPVEPALISKCSLILEEVSALTINNIVKFTFEELEQTWDDIGSPFQRWYRTATSISVDDTGRRISWKSNKPFAPENIFFRTIDSGRLLPMHLADFRVQIYAHKSHWEFIDAKKERDNWRTLVLSGMVSPSFMKFQYFNSFLIYIPRCMRCC
jgi:hypothetical protein